MKKNSINIKVIAACIVFAFFAMNSFGQTTTKTTKESGKKVAKVEKKKVPKEVTKTFNEEFPGPVYEDWYGYPAFDYKNDWFDDWYEYGPFYSTETPEYYGVEFPKEKAPYKIIYSKTGKKIATHKILTSDLPKGVSAAIGKGLYKDWKLGKDKEEIFKDKDSDQMKVYKVVVTKGKEKHTLFFQADGKLLKDKKVA